VGKITGSTDLWFTRGALSVLRPYHQATRFGDGPFSLLVESVWRTFKLAARSTLPETPGFTSGF
jgi:hypothetical protein